MAVQKDEEPEDPERRVSFDFVCGFLVEFAKKETRFRLLYTFLTILGVQLPERQAPASGSNVPFRSCSRIFFILFGWVKFLTVYQLRNDYGTSRIPDPTFEIIPNPNPELQN
jgi:hypothetical protein